MPDLYLGEQFQSSRSLRTATLLHGALQDHPGISILAVLADRDFHDNYLKYTDYISILAVLADRDISVAEQPVKDDISILAVLADRDVDVNYRYWRGIAISILAVLADRDAQMASQFFTGLDFNPRGPCGPRPRQFQNPYGYDHFNPRGPCGPRLLFEVEVQLFIGISILAVLADRDDWWRIRWRH